MNPPSLLVPSVWAFLKPTPLSRQNWAAWLSFNKTAFNHMPLLYAFSSAFFPANARSLPDRGRSNARITLSLSAAAGLTISAGALSAMRICSSFSVRCNCLYSPVDSSPLSSPISASRLSNWLWSSSVRSRSSVSASWTIACAAACLSAIASRIARGSCFGISCSPVVRRRAKHGQKNHGVDRRPGWNLVGYQRRELQPLDTSARIALTWFKLSFSIL